VGVSPGLAPGEIFLRQKVPNTPVQRLDKRFCQEKI
jgi:hypothetical protein